MYNNNYVEKSYSEGLYNKNLIQTLITFYNTITLFLNSCLIHEYITHTHTF